MSDSAIAGPEHEGKFLGDMLGIDEEGRKALAKGTAFKEAVAAAGDEKENVDAGTTVRPMQEADSGGVGTGTVPAPDEPGQV